MYTRVFRYSPRGGDIYHQTIQDSKKAALDETLTGALKIRKLQHLIYLWKIWGLNSVYNLTGTWVFTASHRTMRFYLISASIWKFREFNDFFLCVLLYPPSRSPQFLRSFYRQYFLTIPSTKGILLIGQQMMKVKSDYFIHPEMNRWYYSPLPQRARETVTALCDSNLSRYQSNISFQKALDHYL